MLDLAKSHELRLLGPCDTNNRFGETRLLEKVDKLDFPCWLTATNGFFQAPAAYDGEPAFLYVVYISHEGIE